MLILAATNLVEQDLFATVEQFTISADSAMLIWVQVVMAVLDIAFGISVLHGTQQITLMAVSPEVAGVITKRIHGAIPVMLLTVAYITTMLFVLTVE